SKIAVLNNLEFDHADIFLDLAAIETQFHHLVRTVPRNGRIIVNGQNAALERVLARGCWTSIAKFASADAWHQGAIDANGFEVRNGDVSVGRVQWSLLGEHNRANALAAIAAANAVGMAPAAAIRALGDFANVKRRMEHRGEACGITVYDDFAHHPTAIATTLEGLRAKVGARRILAVLEPRSNTMKLGVMRAALPTSLAAADRVFCYADGLGWDAAGALAPLGAKALVEADFDRLIAAIVDEARAEDQIVVMSNGGFNGIHEKLLRALAAKAAAKTTAAKTR
ncbi:MAG: Mur ligase family protein, partial [Burkholderiales bacterium]